MGKLVWGRSFGGREEGAGIWASDLMLANMTLPQRREVCVFYVTVLTKAGGFLASKLSLADSVKNLNTRDDIITGKSFLIHQKIVDVVQYVPMRDIRGLNQTSTGK